MKQDGNGRKFCTLIAKKEKTSRETISEMAESMAKLWHKEKLLRREIPLFTRFFLSQADLDIMEGLNKGPISCGVFDGEHEYDKELLKLWFIEEGYLAAGIGGNEANSLLIPSCWFENGRPPSLDLDPFEIMLHRHAEEGAMYARAFVETAVMWDAPFVALADVEEFTKGALSSEAFWRLLVLATGSEESVPAGYSLYEKWELAHYCFTLFSTLPQLHLDKGIAVNDVHSGVRVDHGQVFDHFEFITWLQHIVLLMPVPICID